MAAASPDGDLATWVWSCGSLPPPLPPLLPGLIMEISRRRKASKQASAALFVNITRCLLETVIVPATYVEVYRERMTPILFETFIVSAIYVAIQPCRWPRRQFLWRPRRWRHPQCTLHKRPLSSTSLLHKLCTMPQKRPSLISSRQHQRGLMLHQRLSSVRRSSSSGVFCCTSARCRLRRNCSRSVRCILMDVNTHRCETCLLFRPRTAVPLATQFLWRPRRWRHPQCSPHKRPLSSTLPQH